MAKPANGVLLWAETFGGFDIIETVRKFDEEKTGELPQKGEKKRKKKGGKQR